MIIEQPAPTPPKTCQEDSAQLYSYEDSKIKVFFVCSKLEERNQETPIECSPFSQGLKKEVRTRADVTTT